MKHSTGSLTVITSRALLANGWRAALPGARVVGTDTSRLEVDDQRILVLDVNSLDDVVHLLPVEGTDVVWVHAGIEPAQLRRARRLGVRAVVHREGGLAAVLEVLAEGPPAPRITRLGGAGAVPAGEQLTLDEVMVLRLLSRGASAAQVRRETGFTAGRVEKCRQSALRKLGVHTTGEGIQRASQLGMLSVVGLPSQQ